MLVWFYSDQETAFLQILYDLLAAFIAVHTAILSAVLIDCSILVKDIDDLQIMSETDLVVVGIVRRGDLYDAGPEIHLHVVIRDHGDLPADYGQYDGFANGIPISLVIRINCDGGIAQQRLRPRRGELKVSASVAERISEMPEESILLLELDFRVGYGCTAVRTPVDDPLSPVDQPFLIELAKYIQDRLGTSLVHCESLAGPVAGASEILQLLVDPASVLLLPLPGSLEESISSDIVLGYSFLAHGLHDPRLGGNGSMVRSRQPKSAVALHPLEADDDILQGHVKGVAHMKLPGDVGRRHDDGVWSLVRIAFGAEIPGLHPVRIDPGFHLFGIVLFCQFFHFLFSLSKNPEA